MQDMYVHIHTHISVIYTNTGIYIYVYIDIHIHIFIYMVWVCCWFMWTHELQQPPLPSPGTTRQVASTNGKVPGVRKLARKTNPSSSSAYVELSTMTELQRLPTGILNGFWLQTLAERPYNEL